MPGLVRPAVLEVGGTQHGVARLEVVEAAGPEILEVEQMAGVLLNRPATVGAMHPNWSRQLAERVVEPIRGAAQPDENLPGRGGRETQRERPIDPTFGGSYHRLLVAGSTFTSGESWSGVRRSS